MSEMVERLAMAMWAVCNPDNPWDTALDEDYYDGPGRDAMRQMARAAIGAMREPTEAMQRAGFFANVVGNPGGCPGVPKGDNDVDWHNPDSIEKYLAQQGVCRIGRVTAPADKPWQAMIDAALAIPVPAEGEGK